ncbi:MAG: hypothetical protein A2W31_10600 [Planctomycetes bacterium RBG_16_64_10]|nr:MAG: hypothetical protein A2W31_10600 [Planctomycetes bacterium RBG_16_64_10]
MNETVHDKVLRNTTRRVLDWLATRLAAPWRYTTTPSAPLATAPTPIPAARTARSVGNDDDNLVASMLAQGRYTLLLRPQVIDNLNELHLSQTVLELQERMALVPGGQVVVGQLDPESDDDHSDDAPCVQGRIVQVDPVFLDRYPVTNFQYQQFVDRSGYEEMAIWEEHILPALLDFVDRSGHPGPRFWTDGHFPPGQQNHPVVGISWYEASAYARWVGKRLPSDAEWCKAASWPVSVSPGNWLQRKFPWGNTFEGHRANLWGSGQHATEPVDRYAEGVSVGGVHQLIGNVWEWTSGAYGRAEDTALALPVPMKSIRGGAFDTYFESQATCQFQSGENPLSRKHNIGFRLALGACDLAPQATALLLHGTAAPKELELAEEVRV